MRNNPISVRVNDQEKRLWNQKSEELGIPLASLMRMYMNALSLGKIDPPPIVPMPKEQIGNEERAA